MAAQEYGHIHRNCQLKAGGMATSTATTMQDSALQGTHTVHVTSLLLEVVIVLSRLSMRVLTQTDMADARFRGKFEVFLIRVSNLTYGCQTQSVCLECPKHQAACSEDIRVL